MIAPAVLLLSVGALAPAFRFRIDPGDAARYGDPGVSPGSGVAVVLRTREERTRVDLLTLSGDRLPRWKWTDAALVSAGRVTLRAPAGSTALLVLPARAGESYRLDGPFPWPAAPTEREISALPARAIRGSSPLAGAGYEMRLAGALAGGDPLCESDGGNAWQCVGVPRAFSGRLVACRDGTIVGAVEVGPDSSSEAVLRPVAFGALLRVDLTEPDAERERPFPSVRVLRPPAPGAVVLRADPRWIASDLGEGLVWIETAAESTGVVVEIGSVGHATTRSPLPAHGVACAEPIPVLLARAASVSGSVTDPAGSPVAEALVLIRTAETGEGAIPSGDGETDASGEFRISGVAPGDLRVRACHGEHGCAEEPARGGIPVNLRLPGRGVFVGRVLSSAGVPQEGAVVRILPTAEAWAAADDRVKRLPLESRSGSDGRFRISAAENGDYHLEVRSGSSGVARVSLRRSNLSPPVTDLGDLQLPEPIEFTARVSACGSGSLHLSGPLGGATSLPAHLHFRLDPEGSGSVVLPEGGAWTAWASCSGRVEWIEPALLPDAAQVSGLEVRFERSGER